jgi:hypothetical protein
MLVHMAKRTEQHIYRLAGVFERDATAGAERERSSLSVCNNPTGSNSDRSTSSSNTAIRHSSPTPQGLKTDALFTLLMASWHWIRRMTLAASTISSTPTAILDSNIILTDALGRTLRLPFEHFSDYSMIQARLKVAFRDCAGEVDVHDSNYALFRQDRREEIANESAWSRSVAPGTKFVMAILVSKGKARA